ncbi:MAG: hypothetical protein AB1916_06390 [Thermodesulfobacteriota bacterium]
MLGIEKRIREMYGEGYDEETLKKLQGNGTSLGIISLVIAAVALVLAAGVYFQDIGGQARKAAASADLAQAQMRALDVRLRSLETQNGNVQGMLVNSMLNEVKQKAAFLASQPLTPAQKAALAEALAPLAPPAPASEAAPAPAEPAAQPAQ